MPEETSNPIIPEYADPASYRPLIQRSESRLGVCFYIRVPYCNSLCKIIGIILSILIPIAVMVPMVFLFPYHYRWKGGNLWPFIILATIGAGIVISYNLAGLRRFNRPTIIEIRDGRLIIRDQSTFNDWAIDGITGIRTRVREPRPWEMGYSGHSASKFGLFPQPHLEISVRDRQTARLLHQYSMPELEQIAEALNKELAKPVISGKILKQHRGGPSPSSPEKK
jgi:hypothetical protein